MSDADTTTQPTEHELNNLSAAIRSTVFIVMSCDYCGFDKEENAGTFDDVEREQFAKECWEEGWRPNLSDDENEPGAMLCPDCAKEKEKKQDEQELV